MAAEFGGWSAIDPLARLLDSRSSGASQTGMHLLPDGPAGELIHKLIERSEFENLLTSHR